MDTTKNSVEELHEQEKTSVQKQVEELFYGDCPQCGQSWKGQFFTYIYDQLLRREKLTKRYERIYKSVPDQKKPNLEKYIRENFASVKLTEKEALTVLTKANRHLPIVRQSLLATITDKKDTYCCTHCGYTFQVEFDEQKK